MADAISMRGPAQAGISPLWERTVLSSFRHFFVATILMSAAFNAVAQGSVIPQSSARPPDGGDPRSRRPSAPDYRQYEYGKEIFAVKLGCSTCPLGDKPLDEATARRFLSDESLWEILSSKEQEAVTTYLRQRFTL